MAPPTTYDPNCPEEQHVPLPSAPLINLERNVVLQPPLSRRGHGPGLIIFLPALEPKSLDETGPHKKSLDPSPVQKWAEEGFAVVGVTAKSGCNIRTMIEQAGSELVKLEELDIKDKIGILVYNPQVLAAVLDIIQEDDRLVCVVSYGAHLSTSPVPILSHIPMDQHVYTNSPTSSCHKYSTAKSLFVLPDTEDYHAGSAAVAHTRSLVFLRKHIGGPHFDIEAIWDEHTYFEFEVRSVAKTMGTMVAEPYVNHVPTMTGGMGCKELCVFYRDHFIFSNPTDTALEPISRTVGADRIIDEFIFTMTHDRVVDWLLPGVPPSGRKLAIPMMSVVNVRGDRLYHEHIWWDQAGALKQAGVIPSHIPYPLPDGKQTLRLPISGAEAAKLLANETDGQSNEMLGNDWGISNASF
ncbi:hypothetical protein K439DRAFT_1381726 [Ramaria rubella]|nr:hypothetical protein K439DRAFT_1381726 [Ramaria rubella]